MFVFPFNVSANKTYKLSTRTTTCFYTHLFLYIIYKFRFCKIYNLVSQYHKLYIVLADQIVNLAKKSHNILQLQDNFF